MEKNVSSQTIPTPIHLTDHHIYLHVPLLTLRRWIALNGLHDVTQLVHRCVAKTHLR